MLARQAKQLGHPGLERALQHGALRAFHQHLPAPLVGHFGNGVRHRRVPSEFTGAELLAGQGAGGDLLLEIEYAAHPQFEVDGRNIIHVLPVAPWEAALGATVSVPTLGGPVELRVPADSEAGRKLRLRGRGLPGSGSTPAGDQIVELEVLAPKAQNDAEREAYRNLQQAFGDDWRRA